MLNRREMLQGMAACSGAALGVSLLPERLMASPAVTGAPQRVIFFLQNQGFDPATCIPDGMTQSGSLAQSKLPEPIEALEPYKERLHIINGLHGLHTSPSTHSAFFVEAAGRLPRRRRRAAQCVHVIDYELSTRFCRMTPASALVHRHGFAGEHDDQAHDRNPVGQRRLGNQIFMYSNPNQLYQLLFGGISTGGIRLQHEARSNVMNQIEMLATAKGLIVADHG